LKSVSEITSLVTSGETLRLKPIGSICRYGFVRHQWEPSCTTNPQEIELVEFEPNLSSAQFIVNGKQFTTLDSDNDGYAEGNCATEWGCGWWYEICATSNVNQDLTGFWTADGETNDVQVSHVLVKANSV